MLTPHRGGAVGFIDWLDALILPTRLIKSSAGFHVANCLIFLKKHRLNAGASKTFQPQRCGLISMTVIETGQPSAELLGQTSWLVLASAIVCKY